MDRTIRWGILGTGSIAKKFADGLKVVEGAELAAVGSRSQATADAFGDRYDVPRRHGSYEALAADEEVDAVYVATPHSLHKDNSLLCLSAGKAVLCEKPFAINAAEAGQMVAMARQRKLLLMEAMWSRFLPALVKLRELLAAGAIGEVRMLTADFGFRAGWNPEARLLNPALGGGGLLDVGVYTVSLASMVFGRPTRIVSMAHLGTTGVDEQAGMIFGYDGGALALLWTAVRTTTPQEAAILGTDGRIRLHNPWWRGQKLTLSAGGKEEVFDLPFRGNGYNYEAEEIGRCLREGRTESGVMGLDESVAVLKTMDEVRAQWGLSYPME